MSTHTPIPAPDARDLAGAEAGVDPETRCANWRRGCNAGTDGPDGGYLALCYDCQEEAADAARAAIAKAGE